jgi:RING finger/CHY zinc finger protein 1
MNNIFKFNNKKCTHYKNNIQVFATCCNKYYDCHLCHNENNDHDMLRREIYKVKCMNCNCENPPINNCIDCNKQFAQNYCNICNIWHNEMSNVFHCYYCGVCRKGNKKDFFHCHSCDLCLSINCKNNHQCKEYNFKDDCPICLEKFYSSTNNIILLNCTHLLHSNCYDQLIDNSNKNNTIPNCVICKKSIVSIKEYEKKFDKYILENPTSSFYNNWKTEILCNDCCTKNIVKYNNKFHKCIECTSYNTSVLNVIKERKT